MLAAIGTTTLGDDGYYEDATTTKFEADMAALCHAEAGLFVLSGTMGNQIALRSHLTQPPHAVLCDHRGHITYLEAGGLAMLSGALIHHVVPSNGIHLTLEDIKKSVVLDDEVHCCPTKVISLENTLRGCIIPLEECRRISKWAKEHDIKTHLDGARLWEAVAAGAGSITEYAECFDSVTVCFSKGLGAPVGSMLVGSKKFIKQARWMRQSVGGGLRQTGILTAAARCAVDINFGRGPNGEGNQLRRTHDLARRIAKHWQSLGGELELPVHTNMAILELEKAGVDVDKFREMGKERGIRLTRGRIVVHFQTCEEAVKILEQLLTDVMPLRN